MLKNLFAFLFVPLDVCTQMKRPNGYGVFKNCIIKAEIQLNCVLGFGSGMGFFLHVLKSANQQE